MLNIRHYLPGPRAMELMFIACILVIALALLTDCQDAYQAGSAISPDMMAGIEEHDTAVDQSHESSNIRLQSQYNNTPNPMNFSAGSGYYSSHPLPYNSGMGSATSLVNGAEGTSMHHSVQSAQGILGSAEYKVSGNRYTSGDGEYSSESYSSTSTEMRIDETVTEGIVQIGVLQGSPAPAEKAGVNEIWPRTHAWKNPAIEIDEQYIGSFHITKNMTINTSISQRTGTESWLDGFGDYLHFSAPKMPVSISADDVFGCLTCKRYPLPEPAGA